MKKTQIKFLNSNPGNRQIVHCVFFREGFGLPLCPNPLPLIINPPHPPKNKFSPNMVYYNILGIFIIRGVGGFIIRGRGLLLNVSIYRDPSLESASQLSSILFGDTMVPNNRVRFYPPFGVEYFI